jgi:DNA-binding transcriptional MerR regulator/effector-binding domain-containing protein
MSVLVNIGDFSRMTHLSVKALRHYHDVGLLEPAEIDRLNGYRFYDTDQVPVAQVIRRFRDLGMPVGEVRAMLEADDVDTRNKVIISHLERMESQLAETASTVASLRAMLGAESSPAPMEFRSVGAATALALRSVVNVADFVPWWLMAFTELRAAMEALGLRRSGPDSALYPAEFFELERGEVIAYIPVAHPVDADRVDTVRVDTGGSGGDYEIFEVPPAELAIVVHTGSIDDLDRAYGALGTEVAARGIGVDGPIREHYVVSPLDTEDEAEFRIEVGWPVFQTSPG